MDILNNNIIEYVLNEYLDYDEDILKLKQLFNFNFNIKKHLYIEKSYYIEDDGIYFNIICLSNRKIKEKNFYAYTDILSHVLDFKNNTQKYYEMDGKLRYQCNYNWDKYVEEFNDFLKNYKSQ
jgi:hypothetical protein